MKLKDCKIFVAGAAGLVGSTIRRRLLEQGVENVLSPDKSTLDLRDQKATFEYFAQNKPGIVFLAAAKVGGILANSRYKSDFIYDNLAISLNVIKAAADNGVAKLINLGSSCIYPKQSPQPIREDYLLTGKLEPTNEPYAIAKIAALKLCSSFNSSHGTNFITLMPTNLYGENDNFNLETTHVLPAIFRKMLLAKFLSEENFDLIKKDILLHPLGFGLNPVITDNIALETSLAKLGVKRNEVLVWGTGKPLREFMHARDLANACIFFAENVTAEEVGDIINVGSGEEISISKLAELMRDFVGFDGKIIYDLSKPDGTPHKLLDTSRAHTLGWRAEISLIDGLKALAANYLLKLNA